MLAVILLIGMVAIGSIGILLVGTEAMATAEQQSEQERIEQSFVQLSQTMTTSATATDVSQSMDFDAGSSGAITQTEAGNITIDSKYLNQSEEYNGTGNPLEIPIGAIEYESQEGTTVAYQAGGVWRGTGENTQMVSAPPLSYKNETLILPVTSVSEDQELGSGDIRLTHTDTESYGSIPLENETVTMTIYSDYSKGWETYFETQVGSAVVQESNHTSDTPFVKVALTDLDAEGAFDSGLTISDTAGEQGGVDHVDENVRRGSMPEMDNIIDQMVDDVNETGNRSWATDDVDGPWTIGEDEDDSEFSDGLYFADGIHLDGNGDPVTFNLEDGNATVVVDGNITVDGGELRVENWESSTGTDHRLKIYTTGNVNLQGGEMHVDSIDEVDAAQLQVYGTSTLSAGFKGGTFEGTLYAPSDDFDGPNEVIQKKGGGGGQCNGEQVCSLSNPTIRGSIVANSVHFQGGSGNDFEYDTDLKNAGIDVEPDNYSFPPKITYLNIARHKVDVEQN
ncbi:hypothetical protein C489_09646 [Natrinema versiforme JCM 10478]|uniref:DUF7305 domain-containing protein n=1 Tax=Natrinema versiforme JCM 10478 TaxID=1227496 RepID=L9Y142_9EURY|nr:hypothetical protein C489_09646 [Natrinema versiforme JCM 10478]